VTAHDAEVGGVPGSTVWSEWCRSGRGWGGCWSPWGPSCSAVAPATATLVGRWPRDGFHPPDQTTIYVQGAGGDIVGVLFGWPLTAPPARDHQNKILWVARVSEGGDPLRITARLAGSGAVVQRQVEAGPGPSIVDMPRAGCWRFDLTWSGHRDEVQVPYAAR
jgi:hypothetical protein